MQGTDGALLLGDVLVHLCLSFGHSAYLNVFLSHLSFSRWICQISFYPAEKWAVKGIFTPPGLVQSAWGDLLFASRVHSSVVVLAFLDPAVASLGLSLLLDFPRSLPLSNC